MSSSPTSLHTVIAIDGPAASGKSTVARLVASRFSYAFINSGSLYRAMTVAMLHAGVDLAEAELVAAAVPGVPLACGVENGASWVAVADTRLTSELESSEVNAAVSLVARVPAVRDEVVRRLRAFAQDGPLVMEGRDIGSVVFPTTPWKFYIDASETVRQQRRQAQGQIDSVRARDHADSSRASAPLVVPDGAVVIDSSDLSPTEVVDALLSSMQTRGFQPAQP